MRKIIHYYYKILGIKGLKPGFRLFSVARVVVFILTKWNALYLKIDLGSIVTSKKQKRT